MGEKKGGKGGYSPSTFFKWGDPLIWLQRSVGLYHLQGRIVNQGSPEVKNVTIILMDLGLEKQATLTFPLCIIIPY